MVRLLTCVLLCAFCWSSTIAQSVQSQNPTQFNEVDLRVKRVGLGSSYSQVLRRLGRPISTTREKVMDETCGPPYTFLQLKYKGAVVELHGDLRGRDFKVVSMEITSPRFVILPGIKIGMNEQEAVSKLGKQVEGSNELGLRMLTYVTKGNDGGAVLSFRDGRLVKVRWTYTLC